MSQIENENKDKEEKIDKLSKDQEESLRTISYLTAETTELTDKIKKTKDEMQEPKDDVNKLRNKLVDLEDRSRRDNLVFFNIPEAADGTNESCEQLVVDVIGHTGIKMGDVWIDRAHRLGPISKKKEGKTRPIIAKFTYHKQKEEVLAKGKCFKHVSANVSQDYSKATLDVHRKLLEATKEGKRKNSCIKSYRLQYRKIAVSAQMSGSEKFITRSFSLDDMSNDTKWFNFVT